MVPEETIIRIFLEFFDRAVGKVAADNNHKWVFRESPTEKDPNFNTSWNVSIDRVRKN